MENIRQRSWNPAAVLFLLMFLSPALSRADYLEVHHEVNLVAEPSSKSPIRVHLQRGTLLSLLDGKRRNGYYRARLISGGTEGWIYRTFARRYRGEPPSSTPVPSVLANPGSDKPAAAISTDWERPQPKTVDFKAPERIDTCGKFGDAPGNLSNLRKNRNDEPSSYHPVDFDVVASLAYPETLKRDRAKWSAQQVGEIGRFEGAAVSVIGYLANRIKVQTGGKGESTNCHWKRASEVDWHMALVKSIGDPEETAIVVEVTPRIRKDHPRWTVENLFPWVNGRAPVRISGWLLLDHEHRNQLGIYRSTLWEIHPITKIEVLNHGKWLDLDALPSEDDGDEGD